MSSSGNGTMLWRSRLLLLVLWASLVLLWRRGCYLGFPPPEKWWPELQFLSLLVLLPGAVLLLGVPLGRYAAGLLGVLLVGGLVAEVIARPQEQRFVNRCKSTSGPCVIEEYRFGGRFGGGMLFLRGPDGTESFHFYD